MTIYRRWIYRYVPFFIFILLVAAPLTALEAPIGAQKLTGTAVVAQDYTVGYEWRQDADGTLYGPYAQLDFRQKLYRCYTAELDARIFKAAGSDDSADLYLEVADLAYVGPWFSLVGGRCDLGDFLSPGSFFGAYSTMGERQLDSAIVTLPFGLFADIPDAGAEVSAPYNALSFLYVPNLFDADQTEFDGRQGLILGQLRVKFRIKKSFSDIFLNYAIGLDDYFINSSIDEAGTADASYAFHEGKVGCFVNYAMQNVIQGAGTSVAAAGASIDVKKWCFGFLDTLDVEGQFPLAKDPANPFTGGNPQNPNMAGLPEPCWFAEARNTVGDKVARVAMQLFYGGAITNSVGDYTLARLTSGSISSSLGSGFGEGFRVNGLSLRSSNYVAPSGIIFVGYEF
jgi:hypothetical protein